MYNFSAVYTIVVYHINTRGWYLLFNDKNR